MMSFEDAQDCDRAVIELRALNGDFSSDCERRARGVGRSAAGQSKQVEVKVVAVDMRFGRTINDNACSTLAPMVEQADMTSLKQISQEWMG
jgi:hypothetical protein